MTPTIDHSREFQRKMLEHGSKDDRIRDLEWQRAVLWACLLSLLVITAALVCIKTP